MFTIHPSTPPVTSDPDMQCASAPRSPRLLDRVRDAIRVRHYSIRTERAYTDWIRRFIVVLEQLPGPVAVGVGQQPVRSAQPHDLFWTSVMRQT